ncbi:hypothetical protein J9345_19755 [Bacillus subtilis subsp. subtilis]|uniref:PBECR4 domain-containing protein n=2 Tax=Bacillus subtilis TaxID=1423 RepID=UPI001AED1197|nr:hypothetical protein [Bacillus subtilis subsp. subtilis]
MMDKDTFANLTSKPSFDQISIQLLQEYYEAYLTPYVFKYDVNLNGKHQTIELKFNRDNFCHLLGITKIAKESKNVPERLVRNYKGNKGYDVIKKGRITKKKLNLLHKSLYKDMKRKMVWFYLVHRLLQSPKAIEYKYQVNQIASVDIIFFDEIQKAFIHLGILKKKGKVPNVYVPSTFLVEPITQNNDGKKFIDGQPIISVTRYEKTLAKR